MQKKITIIGVNYAPENTSTGLYTTQLAEYFNSKGIDVTVICGFPYYPAWKIDEGYQKKNRLLKENINGVNVFRYKQYVPREPSFFKRILHLVDFTLGSFFNIKKIKRTDAVLCVVPFTSTIFLGRILSKLTKAKLWVHIQDFEFDAAIDTMVSNKKQSLFFKLLFSIEKHLLDKADLTSTISNSMLEKLHRKSKTNAPKLLLPNWVDITKINPDSSGTHKYLKSKKFKILYSGNIGEKQDWGMFLKITNQLQEYNYIEFIVVGDGGKRVWLQERTKNSKNIKHFFPVAYSELSNLLCSADLHILFQKEEVKDTVMPSKMLAMMASKKPSLITGNLDSEVAKIINESCAGKYFSNNQVNEIVNFILELKNNKSLALNYGKNARKYVGHNFGYDRVLEQFEKTFNNLIQVN